MKLPGPAGSVQTSSVGLTGKLTVKLTVGLTVWLTVRLTVGLAVRLTVGLTVRLTVALTVRLTVKLTVGLAVRLTVKLTAPDLTVNVALGYTCLFDFKLCTEVACRILDTAVVLAALSMQSCDRDMPENVKIHGPPGPAGSAAGSAVGFGIRRPCTCLFDFILCPEVACSIVYTVVLLSAPFMQSSDRDMPEMSNPTAPLDQPAQLPTQPSALGSGGPAPVLFGLQTLQRCSMKHCIHRGTVGGSVHAKL